jgi:hypothetical protein
MHDASSSPDNFHNGSQEKNKEKKKRLMSLFIRNEEQILPYMLPTYQHTHLEEDFCIGEQIKREPCLTLRINTGRGKKGRSKAAGQ